MTSLLEFRTACHCRLRKVGSEKVANETWIGSRGWNVCLCLVLRCRPTTSRNFLLLLLTYWILESLLKIWVFLSPISRFLSLWCMSFILILFSLYHSSFSFYGVIVCGRLLKFSFSLWRTTWWNFSCWYFLSCFDWMMEMLLQKVSAWASFERFHFI